MKALDDISQAAWLAASFRATPDDDDRIAVTALIRHLRRMPGGDCATNTEQAAGMTWREFSGLILALGAIVGLLALYLRATDSIAYDRFWRMMLGVSLVVVGIALCLTGIGAVVGLPLILLGLWLQYKAAFGRSG